MKSTKSRVRLRFAPENTGEPLATPNRAGIETDFERLKCRLLARQLAELERPDLIATARRAANEAAALASITFYPLLLFPALFEEKLVAAVRHAGSRGPFAA
jgi:hypothetical protein